MARYAVAQTEVGSKKTLQKYRRKGLTSIMLDIRDSGDPVVSRDVRDNEIVKLEEKYLKCERYAQRNKMWHMGEFQ